MQRPGKRPSGFRGRTLPIALRVAVVLAGLALLGWIALAAWEPEIVLVPSPDRVVPHAGPPPLPLGSRLPRTAADGIVVDEGLIALGREVFYAETFGNERFVTDVVGLLAGPVGLRDFLAALLRLGGRGTTDLTVPVKRPFTVGDRRFREGEILHTGLDVPRGSLLPLGLVTKLTMEGIKVGVTCAACHTAVDPASGKVIEGAPNFDLNAGLLFALAPNSAAYFRHTGPHPLRELPAGPERVTGRAGQPIPLPSPQALEEAVDTRLLQWPPGHFDSTWDMVNNPTEMPDTFTWGDHPYSWSGFASVGPFQGLSAFSSNVHASNSDTLAMVEASAPILGIDPEAYLALLLRNSADRRLRPPRGATPSAWWQQIDPTPGAPGLNELIPLPGYPLGSPFSPEGLLASSPGLPAGRQLDAVAAWQHRLLPPPSPSGNAGEVGAGDDPELALGRRVFEEAGCAACHGGPAFTGNRVVPASEVGTEPSRARAMRALPENFGPARHYLADTAVPLPPDAPSAPVFPERPFPGWDRWPFARGEAPEGAYKIPSLIGLHVTAPYLHDGGAAAARGALAWDPERGYRVRRPDLLGLPGTLLAHRPASPAESLAVLLDRRLRAAALAANLLPRLRATHASGEGHPFWVDAGAGFGPSEQQALIRFLLGIDRPAVR